MTPPEEHILRRALSVALTPTGRGTRTLVNVVDSSAILATVGIAATAAHHFGTPPYGVKRLPDVLTEILAAPERRSRHNVAFVNVDLGDAQSSEDLCPELAVQILKALALDDGRRSKVEAILTNLMPWSAVTKWELQNLARTMPDVGGAILVVRGVDDHPAAWDSQIVRAAEWAA